MRASWRSRGSGPQIFADRERQLLIAEFVEETAEEAE